MPIVSIIGTDQAVEVKEGDILYDSLLDQGIELPHGCLSGSCGACKVEVLEGSENLASPGVIEQNTITDIKIDIKNLKDIRLSCRAKVMGDITIKPIK
jgi:ferredoxin